jgi:GNAT superfamily N-acetyltransferase
VLREGRADARVAFEGDDEWDSFHLAAVDDDTTVVGVITFVERACPVRDGVYPARQFRGMAVAEGRQGEGVGRDLLAAGVDRCRDEGIAVVWAHARLSAVDFYTAHGMTAEGDVYDHEVGDGTLPHRTVVLDLA